MIVRVEITDTQAKGIMLYYLTQMLDDINYTDEFKDCLRKIIKAIGGGLE